MLRKLTAIVSSNIFSDPSLLFWEPYNANIGAFNVVPENPRDGGAWWAAVYRVAQSRTRLK